MSGGRRVAGIVAVVAVLGLIAPAGASAGLLSPGSTLVSLNATILGQQVSTVIKLPEAPAPDAGLLGALGAGACDVADGADGDSDSLSDLVCLLRSAELRIVTEFGPAGTEPLRRETTGIVGLPNLVDADRVAGADISVTATLGEGNRIVLKIDRLATSTGPMPLAVEVFAADPSPETRDRRFGGGYDARESTAPRGFQVSVLPAERPVIDIATTQPGPSLTVLGDIFEVAPDGSPIDPIRARARFAPVPATAQASFEIAEAGGVQTTDADVSVSSPTRLDLDLDVTTTDRTATPPVTSTLGLLGFATLTDEVGVTVTTTPVDGSIPAGSDRLDIHLTRGGPIGQAGATVEQREGEAVLSTSEATLADLPDTIDATVNPETAAEPLRVDATPSGPIGVAEVALAEGMAPARLADERYVLRQSDGAASATTVRVHGLREAHLALKDGNIDVTTRLAAGPLRVDVAEPGLDVDALVADLPDEVALDLRPDSGEVHYDGSQTIADLDLTLRKAAGIRTSERTGVAADGLELDLAGLPQEIDADLVPDQGAPLALDVGPQPLGRATVRLTSDLEGDDLKLPDTEDGAVLRDLAELNALLVRLSGLRSARLLQSGDELDLLLRTALTPDIALDLRQRPVSGRGPDEVITGALRDRPGCLRFALTASAPEPLCGGEQKEPPKPEEGQAHVRYEGDGPTGQIAVSARDLEALPERRDLDVALRAVPERLDAEIVAAPELRRIDVEPTGGALGAAEVVLADGALDALPAGRQGVLVREADVRARVTGLEGAAVRFLPQLDVELRSASGDGITVDTEAAGGRLLARVEAPPDCLRFTVGAARGDARCGQDAPSVTQLGDTNVVLQGSGGFGAIAVDEASGLDGLPEGRSLHVDLTGVPPLLAARLRAGPGGVAQVQAEAPGELGRGEVELVGGMPRDEVFGGGDGLFLRETGNAGRLLARVSRFQEARATLDPPIAVELRGSPPRDLGIDVEVPGADGAPPLAITGELERLPDCLRFEVRSDDAFGGGCGRAIAFPRGVTATNVAYMAGGVPAGGTDLALEATGLIEGGARLGLDLDDVPEELGASILSGASGELAGIEARSGGAGIGLADIRIDSGEPAAEDLAPGNDGAFVSLQDDGSHIHARVTGLRLADLDLDPFDLLVESAGGPPLEATLRAVPGLTGAAEDRIDAFVSRKPSCLRFAVPARTTAACGQEPEAALFGGTNVNLLASEAIGSMDATVSGLAFTPDQELRVDLDNVPLRVGAMLTEGSGGLDRIQAVAAPTPLGSARVALVNTQIGFGDRLLTSDGAFVRGVNDATTVVVRMSDLRSADAELRPLDVLVNGASEEGLDIDVDLLDSEAPSHLVAHADLTERPACARFTVDSEPVDGRCTETLPEGVQRTEAANILYEGTGAEPDANVLIEELDGLPEGRTLAFDLDGVPDGVLATIQSPEPTTEVEELPSPFGDPSIQSLRTTTTLTPRYIHARTIGGAVGRAELRLEDGGSARELGAALDGMAIDERVSDGSEDKGLFSRVTGVERVRLELEDGLRVVEPLDAAGEVTSFPLGLPAGFFDRTSQDYDIDLEATGERPLQVRFESDGAGSEGDPRATVDVSRTPTDVDLSFTHDFGGFTNASLDRSDDGEDPSLDVALRNLGGERTDADVDPIPESLDVCFNDDTGCGVGILPINEDEGEQVDLTARVRSSEPVTVSVDRCEQNGEEITNSGDPDDCSRFDGPEGNDGTKAVYIDDFELQDIDLQVGEGNEERGNEDSEDIQIVGLDSNGTSFGVPGADVDEAQVQIIDYDGESNAALIGQGMRPVVADQRVAGIGRFFGTPLPADNDDWNSGTLACPATDGTFKFFAQPHGLIEFIPIGLDSVLCSNR